MANQFNSDRRRFLGTAASQDFQEQSIRDAEIPPDEYYPKGYKPELIPFWPTTKPIFIPADQVPPGLWLKGKPAAAAQPAGEASKSPVKN
jgi:hypothetical protein